MRVTTLAVLMLAGVQMGAAGRQSQAGSPALPEVEVFKTATCGCCSKWVDHLRRDGFTVKAVDVDDLPAVKARHKVPANLSTCHTALVGNYIVEGHVPVADVRRLVERKPPVRGIAVPGMPIGSPGMEGSNPTTFSVFSFDASGKTDIFATHRPK
jgi:hypothetical protein